MGTGLCWECEVEKMRPADASFKITVIAAKAGIQCLGCAGTEKTLGSGLRRNDELDSRSLRTFRPPTGVIIRAEN